MRNRWRTLALVLLLVVGGSLSGWAAGDWIRWYEHEHEVHVGTVLVMEDEYWLVGTDVTSMDPPRAGIVVFRIQPDGTEDSRTSYDWDGIQSASDALVTNDGNVIFAGRTNIYGAVGSDMYVLRVDSYGQTLSEWLFGDELEEFASRIVLGSNGDYFLVGNQMDLDDVIADPDAPGYGGLEGRTAPYVVRMQSNGRAAWAKDFRSEANVVVFDAAPTTNGGCYLLSTVYGYPDDDDAIRLDRLEEDGTILWSRSFDEGSSKGYSLLPLSDGRLLIAGARRATAGGTLRALLMMVTATGQEVWSRTYGEAEMIRALHALAEVRGGDFVAAGTQFADYAQYRDDVYLLCVDADGEVQWEHAVPTGKHVMIEALREVSDGGLLIAGSGAIAGERFQAMLARVDTPEEGANP